MHNKNILLKRKYFDIKTYCSFIHSTKVCTYLYVQYISYTFTWGQISLKNKSFTTFQRTLNHCRKRNLGLRCQSFCTVGYFSGILGFIFCKEIFMIASKGQQNEYDTDQYFLQFSHHLTSYCFRIYEDLHRFEHKIVFVIVFEQFCNYSETITKTIFCSNAADFLQICANLHKS